MVYVYAKESELQQHIIQDVSVEDIKETLQELGMDLKGESSEDDPELKIEITAEKMDLVSPVGIARAINYYRGFLKELPNYTIKDAQKELFVDESVETIRPKTVAAIIRDLTITPELLDTIIDLQEKLHASFGRNRKKAAIGIYPLQEIEFPITYKAEKPEDIIFHPLEGDKEMNGKEILEFHETGKKYAHLLHNQSLYPVFRDNNNKVLSMPPIINSHTTGKVTHKHKDFFIECSGYNVMHLDSILKVLITTLLEFGGNAEQVRVQYKNNENYLLQLDNQTQTCNSKKLSSLIGVDLEKENIKELLNKVQMDLLSQKDSQITVSIPCYRQDIWNDCDIGDDLARAYGFNAIAHTTPNILSTGSTLPHSNFRKQLSNVMTQLGFLELYTYMLSSTKIQFSQMNRDPKKYVSLIDSADEGINMTRTMILPENLEALRINRKHKYPQKVFECGFIIEEDSTQETGAKDSLVLSATIADPKTNLTQIKEIIDTLSTLFSWNIEVRKTEHPSFISGRCGSIYFKGEEIGVFGEIHPQVLENFGILVPLCSLEINLEKFVQ